MIHWQTVFRLFLQFRTFIVLFQLTISKTQCRLKYKMSHVSFKNVGAFIRDCNGTTLHFDQACLEVHTTDEITLWSQNLECQDCVLLETAKFQSSGAVVLDTLSPLRYAVKNSTDQICNGLYTISLFCVHFTKFGCSDWYFYCYLHAIWVSKQVRPIFWSCDLENKLQGESLFIVFCIYSFSVYIDVYSPDLLMHRLKRWSYEAEIRRLGFY